MTLLFPADLADLRRIICVNLFADRRVSVICGRYFVIYCLSPALVHNRFQSIRQISERSIPVDGNFIGGIGAIIVHIGLSRYSTWIVAAILLSWVGSSYDKARHRCFIRLCSRGAMMRILWSFVAKARDITVAGSVSSQDIIQIPQGMFKVFLFSDEEISLK